MLVKEVCIALASEYHGLHYAIISIVLVSATYEKHDNHSLISSK
jgi:hypothetical protein